MTNTSLYRVEIDQNDGTTAVIHKRCKRCTTAKGMDRQHNRVVNEMVEALRDIGFQRLTVSRIPSDTVIDQNDEA